MAMELDNRCPICLDSGEEASYVMPCLHQFCYPCILRWAESKPECPLCKRRILSIVHSVRADNDFEEHVIPPPAAPSVAVHMTGGAPGHPAARNLHRPAAPQPSAAGLVPRAPVGSLHPHAWAFLFREHPALLRPLMPWLQRKLRVIFQVAQEAQAAARRLILSSLHLFGLNEETLFQQLWAALGRHTRIFVRQLIATIMRRCSGEARRWMGLGDSRGGSPAPSPARSSSPDRSEAEELPSTSSAALHGGPGSPHSVPVPVHREQGEPQEDPGEAVPGPSTPSWGSERSPGGPQRAPKRRAGSPEATSPPNKRPLHRQQ